MSIDETLAKKRVKQHIERIYNSTDIERELVIIEAIPYNDKGWTVYFDTRKSVETGDWRDGLTGNHPIFIFKDSEKMYSVYPETDEAEIVRKHMKDNLFSPQSSSSSQPHPA
jgi:Immunity protein 35